MREKNNIEGHSDRSYLCLVAIYAIHAILLNVVLQQPKLNKIENVMTLSLNYSIDNDDSELSSNYKNTSDIVIMNNKTKNHLRDIGSIDRVNSSDHRERKIIVIVKNDVDDHSDESSTHPFLQQSKSGGEAINFLGVSRTLGISRLVKNIVEIGRSIVEELSPAAIGIIAGCLVYLLTFTENDYV